MLGWNWLSGSEKVVNGPYILGIRLLFRNGKKGKILF